MLKSIPMGSTNKTIDEIALEVGFSNRNHLATYFKNWFHLTPSEYRRSLSRQFGGRLDAQYDDYDAEYAASVPEAYLNEAET
ncbi:MAG TPA: helix-turn-helix domain-containing protein [Anaerovoracaceae bacterium]|nr:helix-turn-helix domain-containing protein [Anaerovoracaceae bacterium]